MHWYSRFPVVGPEASLSYFIRIEIDLLFRAEAESTAVMETVEYFPATRFEIVPVNSSLPGTLTARTVSAPMLMLTRATPLSSVQVARIRQELTSMTVSVAGEIRATTGGTLSGIKGSYLRCTFNVHLFAAGAESIAMNRIVFHSDDRRPVTVAE
jgi:hypothetical protein